MRRSELIEEYGWVVLESDILTEKERQATKDLPRMKVGDATFILLKDDFMVRSILMLAEDLAQKLGVPLARVVLRREWVTAQVIWSSKFIEYSIEATPEARERIDVVWWLTDFDVLDVEKRNLRCYRAVKRFVENYAKYYDEIEAFKRKLMSFLGVVR